MCVEESKVNRGACAQLLVKVISKPVTVEDVLGVLFRITVLMWFTWTYTLLRMEGAATADRMLMAAAVAVVLLNFLDGPSPSSASLHQLWYLPASTKTCFHMLPLQTLPLATYVY